jgi:hypothetical protein
MTSPDLMAYLPDDMLGKVGRARMGPGLEVRVMLLDHRVVTLAVQRGGNTEPSTAKLHQEGGSA